VAELWRVCGALDVISLAHSAVIKKSSSCPSHPNSNIQTLEEPSSIEHISHISTVHLPVKTMSLQGRESPPPDSQHDDQLKAPTAEKPNEAAPAGKSKKDQTNDREFLESLESNPVHPLDKFAHQKTEKKKFSDNQ
jgi:hypothetical protein